MTVTSVQDSADKPFDIAPECIPKHIAMIMDGNGRWAKRNSLPRIEGHRQGTKTVGNIVSECQRLGVKQVTLYCLSHENWKRPEEELDFLIQLFQQFLIESRSKLIEKQIGLKVIGRRDRLPEFIQSEMDKTIQMTKQFGDFCLCLAVNYGARQEIVDAVRSIATKVRDGELQAEDVNEATISDHLYTSQMKDPDLLIRTAGEMRISNYLLWQISYAELWVTQRYWPEFRTEDLHQAIRDFANRERRYGGLVP